MQKEFIKTPCDYYQPAVRQGTLQRVFYSSKTYNEVAGIIEKDALVYLPYGYESGDREYNVLYLMHGGGGNSDEVFGGLEAKTDLKNILDNMIANLDIEPLVVVAPTFYYKGTEDAYINRKSAGELTQNFHHELVKDLIPAIEKNFRVKYGRKHRAFGGYSMGAEATWNVFAKCLNEFQYFIPMSGDCWAVRMQGGLACPKETVEYLEQSVRKFGKQGQDYRLFVCVGDDGVAYDPLNTMVQEMKKHTEYFIFGKSFSTANVIYCVAEGGTHSYEYCYHYLYNALPYIFEN